MAAAEQKTKPFDDLEPSRKKVEAAKQDRTGRVYRVYCDGIFDLFHVGHMKMFEQAKKALGAERTYLIAGVCNTADTQKYKGKTVLPHDVRCDSCRHCKWVDEVVDDAPWVINEEFLAKHKIDFVAHDALPYTDTSGASSDGDVYSFVKRKGMFLETQRTDGISTSDIIAGIIKDYDELIERNLKRGYTKQQLNVGRTWEVRQVAHKKEREFKKALLDTRRDWHDLTTTAKQFLRDFSRRRRQRERERELLDEADPVNDTTTTTGYVYVAGVMHHAVGLAGSLGRLSLTGLSYLNPVSYCSTCCCRQRNKNKKS